MNSDHELWLPWHEANAKNARILNTCIFYIFSSLMRSHFKRFLLPHHRSRKHKAHFAVCAHFNEIASPFLPPLWQSSGASPQLQKSHTETLPINSGHAAILLPQLLSQEEVVKCCIFELWQPGAPSCFRSSSNSLKHNINPNLLMGNIEKQETKFRKQIWLIPLSHPHSHPTQDKQQTAWTCKYLSIQHKALQKNAPTYSFCCCFIFPLQYFSHIGLPVLVPFLISFYSEFDSLPMLLRVNRLFSLFSSERHIFSSTYSKVLHESFPYFHLLHTLSEGNDPFVHGNGQQGNIALNHKHQGTSNLPCFWNLLEIHKKMAPSLQLFPWSIHTHEG